MVNKYYQKRKEKLATVAREKYQILFEEEKNKRQKKAEKDIKILLKKKKGVSIIRNVRRSYLSIEEIIIEHIRKITIKSLNTILDSFSLKTIEFTLDIVGVICFSLLFHNDFY